MKRNFNIRVDISNTGRFTAWESGGWSSRGFGNAVLIGDENCNKLPTLFQVRPSEERISHCCLPVAIGYMIARAYVLPGDAEGTYETTVNLLRVSELSTVLVQGHARATINTEMQFASVGIARVDNLKASPLIVDDWLQEFTEVQKEFLLSAIQKALVPPAEQRPFWAIPPITDVPSGRVGLRSRR